MAYKDPLDERARAKKREHYHANKEQYMERSRAKRAELQAISREARNRPCMDCGVSYPYYVMDFDHRDPAKKKDGVATLVKKGNVKRLLEEIDKCDVVCSNCHRERTHAPQVLK